MSVDASEPKEAFNNGLASARDRRDAPSGLEVKCPECGSTRTWRSGFRRLADGSKVQVYQCGECYHRFTDPNSKRRASIGGRGQALNSSNGFSKNRDEDPGKAGSGSETGVVSLMEKPPESVKRPAGGTEKGENQQLLLNFALWLKKQGRSDSTVRTYVSCLKNINADLRDPESVKEAISRSDYTAKSKVDIVTAYNTFLKFIGGSWEKPRYLVEEKIPFIPTEEELNALIVGCGKKLGTLLQLLKETGVRVGEALKLRWTDVDFERRAIMVTPEKGSRARILPVSENLIAMLKSLPKNGERIFKSRGSVNSSFFRARKRIAKKLNNPRILKITFHTFRHWKATMEYHKTKDIIHVKELLGHKSIENTMIYITIEKALFQTPSDEFYCKTASTIDEASKLIEAGFEYVTTFNGVMLFRKRK